MEPLAPTVEYQVAGLQFYAAPQHRRVRARHKADKYQRRRQRDMGDARHVLLGVQELEVMQRCPGQAGVERTLKGDEEIDPQMAEARLVVIGIDKGARAASRHPSSCMPTGSDPRSETPRCRPEMCRPLG